MIFVPRVGLLKPPIGGLHPVRQVLPHRQAHLEQRLRRVEAVSDRQDLPAGRRVRPLLHVGLHERRPAELAALDEHDPDRAALRLLALERLAQLDLPRPARAVERDELAVLVDDLERRDGVLAAAARRGGAQEQPGPSSRRPSPKPRSGR
jgi:hypothetical protein